MRSNGLKAAQRKMRESGQPEEAIRSFGSAYQRVVSGAETMLPSSALEPVEDVIALEDLPAADGALEHVVVIKLNGGLATSMGLRSPKSLVEARDGRSFLDIIIGQTLALRRRCGIRLPLLLMDSEATRDETLRALAAYPELAHELPADFLQSMVPKLEAERLVPVSWPAEPALEWCPPGHGDVYGALARSGILAALLEQGFRHAMIANADNLGATPEERIAGYVQREQIPFLMEVVEGTAADRKGGHIARRRDDGMLVLRETAQTPDADQDSFRDYRRWRYYNTNNLWVDLATLEETLARHDGVLKLPLIVNAKTVDPRDADSPEIVQLESAMGAAISSFAGARVLRVARQRFIPVKTTDDLLVLRSDVYALSEELAVETVAGRAEPLPLAELDPEHYKLLEDFEARFPAGPPSLVEAERLTVRGEITFGRGVVVRGTVELEAAAPQRIEDGAILAG